MLPAPQGEALLAMARSAFVNGMDAAVLVGAIVALAGVVVALAFLPGRTPGAAAQAPAGRPEETLSSAGEALAEAA